MGKENLVYRPGRASGERIIATPAAQLLKEGESRINEICYMVGFSSSSYFSKCFLKQFGVLPKDFAG